MNFCELLAMIRWHDVRFFLIFSHFSQFLAKMANFRGDFLVKIVSTLLETIYQSTCGDKALASNQN